MTPSPDRTLADTAEPEASFEDRLLAEALRFRELGESLPGDDPRADAAAIASGGSFEARLISRAKLHRCVEALRRALHDVRSAASLIIAAAALMALLAGAATVRTSLTAQRGEVTNIFWVVGAVLGVQTLALLIWCVAALRVQSSLNKAAHAGTLRRLSTTLGAAVAVAVRWFVRRLHRGPDHIAAVQAWTACLGSGRIGLWNLSAISHGLWLAFNVGAIVTLMWLLSLREYTFGWETTILSVQSYTTLTELLGILPHMAGFPVPTPDQIEATQSAANAALAADARQAWSGLLLGSVIMYGFAPRILLGALALGLRRRAMALFRVDTALPGYAQHRDALLPTSHVIGVIDPDTTAHQSADTIPAAPISHAVPTRPLGPPAVIGFELPTPASGWPPPVHGPQPRDLGIVDGHESQKHIIAALAESSVEPATVLIVGSLTTTPDRGVIAFLNEVQATLTRPIALVLTGGHTMRQRGDIDGVASRVQDWRHAAEHLRLAHDRVVEIDLDHLTNETSAALARLLHHAADAPPFSAAPSTVSLRLEQAFDVILQHAGSWSVAPDDAALVELHRRVASCYRDQAAGFRAWLPAIPFDLAASPQALTTHLRDGADRLVRFLPPSLRLNPRWMAAGAAAGAFGCIAAAVLLSPVAISALPAWAAIGAALSAVLPNRAKPAASPSAAHLDEPLRAAVLFALVLELQGHGEARISRILEQTLVNKHETEITSLDDARRWMTDVHARLQVALASEVRP